MATVILRLLLDEGWIPTESKHWDWSGLLAVAKVNNVLLRTAEALARRGVQPSHEFRAAVGAERRRVRGMLELAGRVTEICRARGIQFAVAKAFAQLPDFGADLDVIVFTEPHRFHPLLVDGLNATKRGWRLESWLAGRAVYTAPQLPGPVDVHFGRLGQAGEHVAVTRSLVERARAVVVDGIEMIVPTSEDRLLLQVMHRLYGRTALRIGDLVVGARLIGMPDLDWPYLISMTKREGVLDGLSAYTHFVGLICREVTGRRPHGIERAEGLSPGHWGGLEFRAGLYRFPTLRINATLYARELASRARAGDWRGALRLAMVPVVAGARLLRRAHRQDSSSFGAATTLLTGPALGASQCVDALVLAGGLC
jgi:hypothetical protein